jgi:hypothetical protein
MIHFEGVIQDLPQECARIRAAIRRVERVHDTGTPICWLVATHTMPHGGSVYVAHAARRDWTVTARTADELEDKLRARAEGGRESSRAVQPFPFGAM